MITLRLFATLGLTSTRGSEEFQLEIRPGTSVRDVLARENIDPDDVQMILINGDHAELDSELNDGDRVGVFPAVGGG